MRESTLRFAVYARHDRPRSFYRFCILLDHRDSFEPERSIYGLPYRLIHDANVPERFLDVLKPHARSDAPFGNVTAFVSDGGARVPIFYPKKKIEDDAQAMSGTKKLAVHFFLPMVRHLRAEGVRTVFAPSNSDPSAVRMWERLGLRPGVHEQIEDVLSAVERESKKREE